MRLPVVLDHFNTGVVSNEVRRVTSKFYQSALQKCDNGIITPYGNIAKRMGTKYIAQVQCNTQRMIPFIYSSTQSYVLLFITDHNGVTGDNRIYFLTLDSFVVDGSGNPYYISSPYDNTVDLTKIEYVQKDDIMYFSYPDLPVQKLTRLAENNWTIAPVTFDLSYIVGYGDGKASSIEGILPSSFLEPSNVEVSYIVAGITYTYTDNGSGSFSGTNIVNASIDYATGRFFLQTSKPLPATIYLWQSGTAYKVGTYVLVSNGYAYKCTTAGTTGSTEPAWPTTVGSTVDDNGVVWECEMVTFDSDTPITIKFKNITTINAGAVTLYEDRLLIGNFTGNPQSIMGSVIGSYENFTLGTNDNNAYLFTISSNENNEIAWMSGSNVLLVGTVGSEFAILGGSNGITPKNINVVHQSSYGSKVMQPINVGTSTLFTQLYGERVYKMDYDWQYNGYVGTDMNILNHDILLNGVTEIAQEKEPYNRVWHLINDGTVAILTLLQSQDIFAWQTLSTNGEIKTITSIPAKIDAYDKIYMVIDRNGTKFVESMGNPNKSDYFDNGYSDCYSEYSGTATNTISVPYPDGVEVSVFTDKGTHPNVTVSGGTVTLQWEVTQAIIGYEYSLDIKTLPIEIVAQDFSTLGKMKSLNYMKLQLYKSIDGEIGLNDTDSLLYLTSYDTIGQPLPLFTGIKDVGLFNGFTRKQIWINITHNNPTPFNLISVSFDMEIGKN